MQVEQYFVRSFCTDRLVIEQLIYILKCLGVYSSVDAISKGSITIIPTTYYSLNKML